MLCDVFSTHSTFEARQDFALANFTKKVTPPSLTRVTTRAEKVLLIFYI